MSGEDKKMAILNVFLDGVIVDPHIGYPRFEVKLSAEDLGLAHKDIPNIFLLGKKMLVDKTEIGIFQSLEARGRRECEFYSVATPIPGLRFVPNRVLPDLEAAMVSIRDQFHSRAEHFVSRYETVKMEMLEKYAEYRESLERLYPSVAHVRSSFHFDWTCFAISLPGELHAKAVDASITDKARQNANEIIRNKKDELVRGFEKWSEDLVTNARQAALELFKTVKDKMDHNEVIHPKSIQSLRDYVDTFRTMNFVGDTRMEAALIAAKGVLDGVNNKFQKDHVKEVVGEVLKAAADVSDVNGVTGRYKRRLMSFDE
jgi:hypothetical protein